MRDAALLGARLLLGSYMGIHASQKLFGKFRGPGLETIGQVFEKNGLAPGREMAMVAAATEITGGVLTIAGIADPAGPSLKPRKSVRTGSWSQPQRHATRKGALA
jgi:putative oxidoreductase